MKRLFVLLACLLAVPAQGQILSIIMGGTNQPAATPTFSPVAGAVTNPTTVTASTSTSDGCTIYFDTSNPPVTAQTTYSVTTGVTLYAQARGCAHHRDSAVGSATYTISAGFSDSFPYSAGDLAAVSGGNWTYNGTPNLFLVVTGSPNYIVATNVCSSNTCFAAWTGVGSFTPSQYASVTFGPLSGNQQNAGPAVEVSTSAQTGYQLECLSGAGSGCFLAKSVAGSRTLLVYPPVGTVSSGDTWAIQAVVSGSSVALTAYQNGSLVSALSYTDSSSAIVSGVPGMFGQQNNPPQIVNAAGGSGVYP